MYKKEQLDTCLSMLKRCGVIDASAIVTTEGLLIASDIFKGTDPAVFAAMSATMMGAAETALIELRKGHVNRFIVETSTGRLIAIGAGSTAVLVVLTGPEAPLGTVLLEMGRSASRIQEIL
ncbi:MAG: roadblock/LC7 domain-containing protein [Candidatus Undinarchaeales archaeon]|jgi:hypothetical protein|nr:roadblock/LC7 domain-containing protein [Candidatus Undinarchaeales archaeon]MDP7493436.1 roadblock/LC7 domain-containing protein [Candidatus Undinarchaeales archaeon]